MPPPAALRAHFGRVDDAFPHEIAVLVALDIVAEIILLFVDDFADNGGIVLTRIEGDLACRM
jgi:hypothetical protein